jgi:SAM-dependent methyltransferase
MNLKENDSRTRAEEVYADAYFSESEQFGHPDRKIVAGLPEEGLRILSLGSGSGGDLWFLAGQNEVYALDGSLSAVEVARVHGLQAQIADLEQSLPFAASTFDVVVAKDLIEHLLVPERLLAEARRVLKPGGRLVLSVPNHFYLPFRLRILFGGNLLWKSLVHDHSRPYEEWNYMHLRFFTWGGLQRLLAATDFQVERAFWDFGTLAHYVNPGMFHEHLVGKYADRLPTLKARFFFSGLYPVWRLFNILVPPRLRHFIVGLAPGLLCAGFYLHCIQREEA